MRLRVLDETFARSIKLRSLGVEQDLLEDGRMIEQRVPGAIDESHAPMRRTLPQRVQSSTMLAKLSAVTLAELEPTIWIVVEPFPQLGTWRQIAQPLIERGILLPDAARP